MDVTRRELMKGAVVGPAVYGLGGNVLAQEAGGDVIRRENERAGTKDVDAGQDADRSEEQVQVSAGGGVLLEREWDHGGCGRGP